MQISEMWTLWRNVKVRTMKYQTPSPKQKMQQKNSRSAFAASFEDGSFGIEKYFENIFVVLFVLANGFSTALYFIKMQMSVREFPQNLPTQYGSRQLQLFKVPT